MSELFSISCEGCASQEDPFVNLIYRNEETNLSCCFVSAGRLA